VDLVGADNAGPWVLLARGLCGGTVRRTAADVNEFRFDRVEKVGDEMMLPGALKYGGLFALAAGAAPAGIFVHAGQGAGSGRWLEAAYTASGRRDNLKRLSDKVRPQATLE